MSLLNRLLCYLGFHDPVTKIVGVKKGLRKPKLHYGKACSRCGFVISVGDPLR